jgi:hypothetical protein
MSDKLTFFQRVELLWQWIPALWNLTKHYGQKDWLVLHNLIAERPKFELYWSHGRRRWVLSESAHIVTDAVCGCCDCAPVPSGLKADAKPSREILGMNTTTAPQEIDTVELNRLRRRNEIAAEGQELPPCSPLWPADLTEKAMEDAVHKAPVLKKRTKRKAKRGHK